MRAQGSLERAQKDMLESIYNLGSRCPKNPLVKPQQEPLEVPQETIGDSRTSRGPMKYPRGPRRASKCLIKNPRGPRRTSRGAKSAYFSGIARASIGPRRACRESRDL